MNPSGAEEVEVPKGSYAAGRRVRLPTGAEEPIRVYINSIEQPRGEVWNREGNEIVFTRPIIKEIVTKGRWLAMYIGIFGTYRKHETVDIEYMADGKVQLAADVRLIDDTSENAR